MRLADRSCGDWMRDALDVAPRVVVFDYMTTTAEMAARPWRRLAADLSRPRAGRHTARRPREPGHHLRCRARPARGGASAAAVVSDQRTFLSRHGIDGLVEEGRAAWEAGAARGDLAAIQGRSRVREAEALTDIDGLGAFTVAEWTR